VHNRPECKEFIKWVPGLSPKEHMELVFKEQERRHQEELQRRDRELKIWLTVIGFIGVVAGAVISAVVTAVLTD